MEAASFYLLINDHVRGPYAENEVRDMLRHRDVALHTPACREGETEWATVQNYLSQKVAAYVPHHKSPVPAQFSTPHSSPVPAEFSMPKVYDPLVRKIPAVDVSTVLSTAKKASPNIQVRERRSERIKAPGIGRMAYILGRIGITAFFGSVLGILFVMLPRETIYVVGPVIVVLDMALHLWLISLRMENIGEKAWQFLLFFVPVANLYVSGLCLTAPPEYKKTKELDRPGKILFWSVVVPVMTVLILLFLAIFTAIVAAAALPPPRSG